MIGRPPLARALAAGVLALAASAGCRRSAPPESRPAVRVEGDVVAFQDSAAESATVRVAAVARAADDHVNLTGRLVWDEDVTARVFSPVAGRVARIARDFGAPVARGGLLAELSSPDFGQAQADAARADSDLRAARRSLERVSQVFERGGVARKDRDQAQADLERASAEAERTRRRLELWGGSLARSVDESFALRSPVAGMVVERNLNPGQEVRPDATTPLFVVSDPRRLWVMLDITERDVAVVEPGARLAIRVAAFPDLEFNGVLDALGAGLDPATRTVRARGRVSNSELLLRAEMYVTVAAAKRQAARAVLAPARAVLQEGEKRYVFVEAGAGRYRRVPVELGVEREGVVPVLSGLADGARIAVEGELLLEAAWNEARRR